MCTSAGESQQSTCDEDPGGFLRRLWAAVLLVVPPAHLPAQRTEAAESETALARQAQRSRRADTRRWLHVRQESRNVSKGSDEISGPDRRAVNMQR